MEFKELYYYTVTSLFIVAILYLILFKAELLSGSVVGSLTVIIGLILKQLFNRLKEVKNGHRKNN